MKEKEKLAVGICDDEESVFAKTGQILTQYGEQARLTFDLHFFESGEELLAFTEQNPEALDIIFMDIEMEGGNGIEAANKLIKIQPRCQLVYHTNYLSYATDVYETGHCYFVLKNQLAERLPAVMGKILKSRAEKLLVLPHRATNILINKNEIIYIERELKKTFIYLTDGRVIDSRLKLDELLPLLGEEGFVRCHHSFIAAFAQITAYKRQELIMSGGYQIPISRRYSEVVKLAFAHWGSAQF